jgi:hypothetical protein
LIDEPIRCDKYVHQLVRFPPHSLWLVGIRIVLGIAAELSPKLSRPPAGSITHLAPAAPCLGCVAVVVVAITFAHMSEHETETNSVIVTYRAAPALAAALDRAAAAEGITRSDVARRAALRELRRAGLYPAPGGPRAA